MTMQTTPIASVEADQAQSTSKSEKEPSQLGTGSKKVRLIGIDVSRGLALLGMMAVHSLIPFDQDFNPNWVSYIATGNASAVFALLAGVGLSLTTGRAAVPWSKASATAASIAGRAVAIGVIGLLLGYTEAEIAGVILPYYAVLFLLAIPLLFLRTPVLVGVGVFVAVVVPVLSQWVRPALPEATLANPSFAYLFEHPLGLLSELTVTGAYPALPWLSYICAGLILGRLNLSSAAVARRMVLFGAALAVAVATASWWLLGPLGGRAALLLAGPGPLNIDEDDVDDLLVFGFDGATPTTSWWWLASDAPHGATPLDLLRTIGTAVAVLGAMLLLGHIAAPALRRFIPFVTAPLAAAGSMTLTLYTAHVVFLNSPLDQFSPVAGYVFQVTGVLLFALGWRQAVGRGPLETAVTAVANRARARVERAAGRERGRSKPRPHFPSTSKAKRDQTGPTPSEPDTWSWWTDDPEDPVRTSANTHPRRAMSPDQMWNLERQIDEQDSARI